MNASRKQTRVFWKRLYALRTLFALPCALVCLVLVLVLPEVASADTVFLRNGSRLEGRVVMQNRTTVTIRTAERTITVRKTEIRRLTYGALSDPEEARREREAKARKAREAEERRQAAEKARAQREQRAKEEQLRREQQELQEAEVQKKRQEEEHRLVEEQRREGERRLVEERKRAEESRRLEEERKREEERTKKAEAERREREERSRREEESRRLAELRKHQYSRGVFVLSGGRQVSGVVERRVGQTAYVRTSSGLFILQPRDIEKVIIQTQTGPKTIRPGELRGVIESEAPRLEISGRRIEPDQVQRVGADFYARTPQGLFRLDDGEVAALGLRRDAPPGPEPVIGENGVFRLAGGTEVQGRLVSRDAHELVVRAEQGLVFLAAGEVVFARKAPAPAQRSWLQGIRSVLGL